MANIMVIIAMLFFAAAIACGVDAFKLEGKISATWIVVICWSLLLAGLAVFMAVILTE